MPNGKPGDHPLTDILIHHRKIYSAAACDLVHEIAALADEKTCRDLADMLLKKYNEYAMPNVAELERHLTDLLNKLKRDAKARGFETKPDK